MEWLKDYWYVILLGLFAAMLLFGRRSHRGQVGKVDDHQHDTHTGEKVHKGGHGCCH